jgi:hypothetical protein
MLAVLIFCFSCMVGFNMFEQTKRLIRCSHEVLHSNTLAFDLVFELYVTCRRNCLSFHFELEYHVTKTTESLDVRCQTKFRACILSQQAEVLSYCIPSSEPAPFRLLKFLGRSSPRPDVADFSWL